MTSVRSITSRVALAGAAILTSAVAATPASAESGEIAYRCEWFVGSEVEGDEAPLTGTFDTGVEDGLVVDVGDEIGLSPFTASLTLPEAFVEALRTAAVPSIAGDGLQLLVGAGVGDVFVDVEFADTPVPADGAMTLAVTGDPEPVVVTDPGPGTIVAESFILQYGDDETGGSIECLLALSADEQDLTIDRFDAVAAATPTPSPTASASTAPARPVVVQTDFADDDPAALPAAIAGGPVLVGLASAVAHRRAGARRH